MKSIQIVSTIFLLLLVFTFSSSQQVIELNESNFDQTIYESTGMWMVAFVAPWCGYCKRLEPEYEKAAKSLGGVVNIAKVNADLHKNLAARFQVKGFPTIKFFPAGDRKAKQNVEDYQSERSAKAIVDYSMYRFNSLPDPVRTIQNQNSLEDFVKQNNNRAKVILFSQKPSNPSLYKSIALELQGQNAVFGFVGNSDTKKDLLDALELTDPKSLIVIPAQVDDLKQRALYSGELKKNQILQFLKPFVSKSNMKQETKSSNGDSSSTSPQSSPPKPIVNTLPVELTSQKQFTELCQKLCVIGLVANEQQKKQFESISETYSKQVPFTYVTSKDVFKQFNAEVKELEVTVPVVLVRSQKKKIYRKEDGLSQENAFDFFDRILYGQYHFETLSELPVIGGKDEL